MFSLFLLAFVLQCSSLRTIGTSLPGGGIFGDIELDVFSYNITDPSERGMMTFLWFTGRFDPPDAVLFRYYVDGKDVITLPSHLAFGVGQDHSKMFGHSLFGKGASSDGIYSNVRIPFSKSIRVTATTPTPGQIFVIVRGLVGKDSDPVPVPRVQLAQGEILLPPTARLQVSYINNKTLLPFEYLDLFDTTSPSQSTALVMTILQVDSFKDPTYLEGCVRAYDPNLPKSENPVLLSSGTEDYFQSADYYDGGEFSFPGAGVTYWSDGSGTFYKVHGGDLDVVVFDKGVRLAWRNCETIDLKTGLKCTEKEDTSVEVRERLIEETREYLGPKANILPIVVNAFVYYYTW